jgi:hypothetical protein
MDKTLLAFSLGYVAILLLSLDFYSWGVSEPFFAGLPFWVLMMLGLTLLLSVYYFLFSVFCWRDS